MAVARFASDKPLANVDTLLYTVERTALTSVVAVNISGFTRISAWIVPSGEDEAPDNWIYYINNIDLTNRNTFETFKIAVNAGDKIYASSESGQVTFFINGIFDVTGRANVTIGEQEPESPQIGDVWIRSDLDPQQIYYWEGAFWQPLGITGPSNVLTVGTVEDIESGGSAEVEITGTSPDQVINFVIPRGIQGEQGIQGETGPANTLTVGTVEAAEDDTAEVTITGAAPDQIINFVMPRGLQGIQGETGPRGEGLEITGSVPTEQDLPLTGNENNDAYITEDDGHLWIWTLETSWVDVGEVRGPAGVGVPPGGNTYDIMIKLSNNDYDTTWSNIIDGGNA